MGVNISTEEVPFLQDFGAKFIHEQDKTLLENRMTPITEDYALRNFLNINGAYTSLIRGLCDLVSRKHNEDKEWIKLELKTAYNNITTLEAALQSITNKNNELYSIII